MKEKILEFIKKILFLPVEIVVKIIKMIFEAISGQKKTTKPTIEKKTTETPKQDTRSMDEIAPEIKPNPHNLEDERKADEIRREEERKKREEERKEAQRIREEAQRAREEEEKKAKIEAEKERLRKEAEEKRKADEERKKKEEEERIAREARAKVEAETRKKEEALEKEIQEAQKRFTVGPSFTIPEKEKVEEVKEVLKEEKVVEPVKPLQVEKKETAILFEDIEKNEEVFEKILEKLNYLKENIELPEKDKEPISKIIETDVIKAVIKLKEKTEKKIEKEDIDEDEYSEDVTYPFVKILNSGYRRVLNILIDKEENKALGMTEKILSELGFQKIEYDKETIDLEKEEILESFEIVVIQAKNPEENNKVSRIALSPYVIGLIESDEKKEAYIQGKLFLMKYKEN